MAIWPCPITADLEIESVPAPLPQLFIAQQSATRPVIDKTQRQQSGILTDEEKARMLQEVEQQQADFGIK